MIVKIDMDFFFNCGISKKQSLSQKRKIEALNFLSNSKKSQFTLQYWWVSIVVESMRQQIWFFWWIIFITLIAKLPVGFLHYTLCSKLFFPKHKWAEVISSIMTKLERAKNIHLKMELFLPFKLPLKMFMFQVLSKLID